MCFREVETGLTNLLNSINQPINKIILNNFPLEETVISNNEYKLSKLEVIEINACQMSEKSLILLLGNLLQVVVARP